MRMYLQFPYCQIGKYWSCAIFTYFAIYKFNKNNFNQWINLRYRRHYASTVEEDDEGYWREVKAIIGGVLGFWGGIGSLGTLFLVVVMSKRYCCRDVDDKESDKDG